MKFFILFMLLGSTLFASYEQAQKYYEHKEYTKAIAEAKSSFVEYSNPNLHLLWAKSAEALGSLTEAMSAYERVVILNESIDAKLALVRIYAASSRELLAEKMLKELEHSPLTKEQKVLFVALKSQNSYRSEVNAGASLSFGYDSNINVSATGSILDDLGILQGAIRTPFSRISGGVSYLNELQERGGWYLQADLNLYHQNNTLAHYYDMTNIGASVGAGYKTSQYALYIPLSYSRFNYLATNLFTQVKIAPEIEMNLSEKERVLVTLDYSKRNYLDAVYKTLGDSSFGIGINYRYAFAKNSFYAGSRYEKYLSSYATHPNYIDKRALEASVGVNYRLNDWLGSTLEYKFRRIDYTDKVFDVNNLLSPAKRADSYSQIKLKFSHDFMKKYQLFLSGEYMKNDSKNLLSSYSKNIVMFGINGRY